MASQSQSPPPPYYNNDKQSFAWSSARKRWPVILTNAIDDVHQAVGALTSDDTERIAQGKKIISQLVELKHNLEHDRKLVPLEGNGEDLKYYNDELKNQPADHSSWLTASWLYSECYLYRLVGTFFDAAPLWNTHDVFLKQKDDTFQNSQVAVSELALRYHKLADQLSAETKLEALEVIFQEFIDISLWGNATDLSLLTNISLEDIQALQGAESRKKNAKNVLANDLDQVWATISATKGGRIDIVLDNAGFELYTDLLLALFFLDSGLADHVVLHPKDYPWFVSDVMPADVDHIVHHMLNDSFFETDDGKSEERKYLVNRLIDYRKSGKITTQTSPFWTTCADFWHIRKGGAAGGEAVWQSLQGSKLVIFKGDLNHRKLLGDLQWPKDTPYLTAIGPLASNGLRMLTLRTCKADTASGLPKGREEELEKEWAAAGNEEKQGWVWSGKYALVQFSDGSK